MKQKDILTLKAAIQDQWPEELTPKARRYLGKFFDRVRLGPKVVARVQGNYGTYTVSLDATEDRVVSACSCYIGKYGGCHHCQALAGTFLQEPESFQALALTPREQVQTLADLESYLKRTTLGSLLQELKAQGITQKALAASVGMNPRQLAAIKAGERRNRSYHELGAVKLACVWILEHFRREK